jgi:cell division septation protein DedD
VLVILLVLLWAFGLGWLTRQGSRYKHEVVVPTGPSIIETIEKKAASLFHWNEKAAPPAPSEKTPPKAEPEEPKADNKQSSQYTVQVAALRSDKSAAGLVDELKSKGYDAYYDRAKTRGRRYYRVRVGRFTQKDEAAKAKAKLAQDGFEGAMLYALAR